MKKKRSAIPLCKSDFLQDITIALGRRSLKSLRKLNPVLTFSVMEDERSEHHHERFDVEARNSFDRLTKIAIWEGGAAWVFARERLTKSPSEPILDLHANLAQLNAEEIAELIRFTLADPFAASTAWKNL